MQKLDIIFFSKKAEDEKWDCDVCKVSGIVYFITGRKLQNDTKESINYIFNRIFLTLFAIKKIFRKEWRIQQCLY